MQIIAFPAENKLAKIPSVPLGMESTTPILKTDKSTIFTALRPKTLNHINFQKPPINWAIKNCLSSHTFQYEGVVPLNL